MPNVADSTYKAHKIKYFMKFDLVCCYYQVPVDKESRGYTAFSTTKNHFQFKWMSFSLNNSGIAFLKIKYYLHIWEIMSHLQR